MLNNLKNRYVQFIDNTVIDGTLFRKMSFYCHVKTETKAIPCTEDNEYKTKEFYTFIHSDKEYEVNEDNAFLRDDCPGEMFMNIDDHRFAYKIDETKDMFKAVKELTGHDIKACWGEEEAYTANDKLGVKKGGYGGTPIPGEAPEGKI